MMSVVARGLLVTFGSFLTLRLLGSGGLGLFDEMPQADPIP
jgi:hypothetical protein